MIDCFGILIPFMILDTFFIPALTAL
jgi:hypothetical protein